MLGLLPSKFGRAKLTAANAVVACDGEDGRCLRMMRRGIVSTTVVPANIANGTHLGNVLDSEAVMMVVSEIA